MFKKDYSIIYIDQIISVDKIRMGCSYVAPAHLTHKKVNGPVGMLQIQICKLQVNEKNPLFKGQDLKLKLFVSNQQFVRTKKQIQQAEMNSGKFIFTCFINSLYKQFGRMLMADMWSQETLLKYSSQTRAIGLIDLNSFLQRKNQNDITRCYLNLQKHNAGHLDLKIKFKKLQYFNFVFRINKFSIQNSQAIKGDCFCRVYAGQQILQTHLPLHNARENKAKVLSKQLQFCIPKGMQQIQIQVLEKVGQQSLVIGQAIILLDQMTNAQIEKPFKVDLQDNMQRLGYIQVQIIEQQSGKSLKQMISQGVYSMQNVQSKDMKGGTTIASTNYFHTQKKTDILKQHFFVRQTLINKQHHFIEQIYIN